VDHRDEPGDDGGWIAVVRDHWIVMRLVVDGRN